MVNESIGKPVPGTYWADADCATRQRWRVADLWSLHDLSALCCGLTPDKSRPASAPLNEAEEAIRRAWLAGVLAVISPSDTSAGDHLYGHAHFFRPAEATRWAGKRFPAFPFTESDFEETSTTSIVELPDVSAPRWPWGTHETDLLRHLAAAAERWWVNFDPADNTTAPTNEQVSAWLKGRGVAARTAEVMASILRADGLPTGPRT